MYAQLSKLLLALFHGLAASSRVAPLVRWFGEYELRAPPPPGILLLSVDVLPVCCRFVCPLSVGKWSRGGERSGGSASWSFGGSVGSAVGYSYQVGGFESVAICASRCVLRVRRGIRALDQRSLPAVTLTRMVCTDVAWEKGMCVGLGHSTYGVHLANTFPRTTRCACV